MKATFLLLLLSALSLSVFCQIDIPQLQANESIIVAQNVTISQSNVFADGKINTTGTLTISAANAVFDNITINAQKIIITYAVTNITIIGTVKFTAPRIEIQGGAAGSTDITVTAAGPNASLALLGKSFVNPLPVIAGGRIRQITPVQNGLNTTNITYH